jgi:hypothetical protein
MLDGRLIRLRPVREADLDRLYDPVSYWDAFELSYQLYDEGHAGRGYTT